MGAVMKSAFEKKYENPFLTERADPFIGKGSVSVMGAEKEYYFFTSSYPAVGDVFHGYDRIILRRAETVDGLRTAEEAVVWKAHEEGELCLHIWAPEIHKIGGVWYILFTAAPSTDRWHIRPCMLRCRDESRIMEEEGWEELGHVKAMDGDTFSFRDFSLDMTYLEHRGEHYLAWAQKGELSSIYMARIRPEEPWQLASSPVLLTKPEYPWEMVKDKVNEAPFFWKANGRIYLFYSASGTGSEYCVGCLWAGSEEDLMDPASWHKLDHPILSANDVPSEYGPGHNSVVEDQDGALHFVYHARPAEHEEGRCGYRHCHPLYDPCRHARIRHLTWSEQGLPVIEVGDN